VLIALTAASSMSAFADVAGNLSDDGHVLTVDVAGWETFDASLVSDVVTNLVKTGLGTLTVSADLSAWKGTVTIAQGTYKATQPSSLGDVTTGTGGSVEVADGATLELVGNGAEFSMPKKSFAIGGMGVSSRGAVVYSGSGGFSKASLGNDISVRSDALVSVEGDFHVYWNTSPTYIRLNGNVLTLKPHTSRSFLLGYPNTPEPQGGQIVIDGNTLSLMNPNAAITGDGSVVVTNSANLELSSLTGEFGWHVDMTIGSRLRSKAKTITGISTNVNCIGGAISTSDAHTPVYFAYDSATNAISIYGKVSGGGFSLTRDSRVADAQFHLFNSANDFANGIVAAPGIDVYLWNSGALPTAGGMLSMDTGRVFIMSTSYCCLPGASFSNACSVVGGVGRWSGAIIKAGQGALTYNSAVDGDCLTLAEGTVSFCPVNRAKIAGLYEGRYVYAKNTTPNYTHFFNGSRFPTNSIVRATMTSYDSNYYLWSIPNEHGGDTRTVIAYKGWIWNNTDHDVTWAFAGSEANESKLAINGTTVYDQTYNTGGSKWIGHGTATLHPGANEFFYGVYAGGLTGAPNSWFTDGTAAAQGNWKKDFGLAVNKSGEDTLLLADYEPLMDPGDGSVYTYALPGQKDIVRPGVTTPPSDANGVLPDFTRMSFASDTGIDFGGVAKYTLNELEGLTSVSGVEQLALESEWRLDAERLGRNEELLTTGWLELMDGLRLSVTNAKVFKAIAVDNRWPIARAMSGVVLNDVDVFPDVTNRRFGLSVSDDGKTLFLVGVPMGFTLVVR